MKLYTTVQGRILDIFRRGCTRLLLYFNTNKPRSFFFFAEYQLYQKTAGHLRGKGCAPPSPSPQIRPCCVLNENLYGQTIKTSSHTFSWLFHFHRLQGILCLNLFLQITKNRAIYVEVFYFIFLVSCTQVVSTLHQANKGTTQGYHCIRFTLPKLICCLFFGNITCLQVPLSQIL